MGARKRNTAEQRKEAAKNKIPGNPQKLSDITAEDETGNRSYKWNGS